MRNPSTTTTTAARERMPTIPEDLGEYARIHTGPGSWSETSFEYAGESGPELVTPRPPYVELSADAIANAD